MELEPGNCDSNSSTSNVDVNAVWQTSGSTTLLMTEGFSAVLQTVRLIHLQSGKPPLNLELFGNNILNVNKHDDGTFSLSLRGINMAMENWDCVYTINFSSRTVAARFENYTGTELTAEVCEAQIASISLTTMPVKQ